MSWNSFSLAPLARAAAGFLLPSRCLACARADVQELCRGGVCRACWDAVAVLDGPRCEVCDAALPAHEARLCGRCLLDPPAFQSLRAAAPYRGAARDVLLAFKFRGADYLAAHFAETMRRRLPAPEGSPVIAAVPATGRARRSRGYHPAEVLASAVASGLGLRFRPGLLRKVRETEVQSRLPFSRRTDNVRRAFRAESRELRGARVLLVDDVATSGATARECARRLAEAGAKAIAVWCFARASRLDPDWETTP